MKALLFILFLSSSLISVAQKDPFKFGKIDVSDINIDSCDFYPEAHSMILGMYGNLRFMYDENNGFEFMMDVIVRKKIFNKVDLDAGTFKIRYYEPENSSSKEEISGLKAVTYNIIDGKIKETKASKSDQFDERLNDYWKEITVTMPEVQEGSVIEYTYSITSPFLTTLKPWYFQSDIPVKYSEFRALLPEYYNYQLSNVGSVAPVEVEESIKSENFSYSYKVANSNPKVGAPSTTERTTFTSNSRYKRFIAKDITPIIEEPFMNNKVDLPNRIEFQLISKQFPQQPLESMAENYNKFNEKMLSSENFGGKLNKGNFAKDHIATLEGKSDIEKAASIYEWLRKHFTWNGYTGFTSKDAGRPTFNEAKGTVGDINLTLVSALREAGLDAHPVILSSRGHGTIHPVYPSYDDFNYVVALIKTGGNYVMADATSNMPFGMLPERCLNGKGWVAEKNGGFWVNMKGAEEYNVITFIQTSFNEVAVTSNVNVKEAGYAAANRYEEWKKDGEQKYIEKLQGALAEWEFDNYKTENNSIAEGLKYTFSINRDFNGEDIIYLNPLPYGSINENPFKREERMSPIDLPYARAHRVISQIQLPEGYAAELPEPTIIRLPENAGQFIYNVSQVGTMLSITSDFRLSKTDFTPLDYPSLKQFFQLIAEKNQALIVIKKI